MDMYYRIGGERTRLFAPAGRAEIIQGPHCDPHSVEVEIQRRAKVGVIVEAAPACEFQPLL